MLGKKKVKVTDSCVENTDFAYAAKSRPGHMPSQLPARLSSIRSIQTGVTGLLQRVAYEMIPVAH